MSVLTARELEVLRLIAEGQSTKQIAATLGIAFKTAAAHRAHILEKTGAANAAGLISIATRDGLVNPFQSSEKPVQGQGDATVRDFLSKRVWNTLTELKQARSDLAATLAKSEWLRGEANRRIEAFAAVWSVTQHNLRELSRTSAKPAPLKFGRRSAKSLRAAGAGTTLGL